MLFRSLDARCSWKELDLSRYESPFQRPLPPAVIPLFGTSSDRDLSPEERQSLGKQFIKLNAEALILLEQALLLAMRSFRKRCLDTNEEKGACKLAQEEYYHTRAFRSFLRREEDLEWRENSLFLFRNRRCRKWLAWIAKTVPLSLCLPGAKIEAFSLSYSQFIREAFGGWEANSWAKIQHLHVLDEAQHVPVQFAFYRKAFPRGLKGLLVVAGTLCFIGILQVLLLTGNWRMVRNAMPKRSRLARLRWTLRTARWCVRDFPPYATALPRIRRYLQEDGMPYGKFFSFMTW